MRTLFLCLTLLACDDTGNTVANDLSVLNDLSGNKPDSFLLSSCSATEACATQCTAANINTCIPACIAKLDPAAKTYFDALSGCAGPACTVVDGGAGPCSDPSSQACKTCVMASCSQQLYDCQAH
jgi:hypothetical protein